MQTRDHGRRYSPDDDWLPRYEEAVHTVVFRHVLQTLYGQHAAVPIEDLMRDSRCSLTSLARAYIWLSGHELAEQTEDGIRLTPKGRIWAVKNRKGLFWPRVVVRYRAPDPLLNETAEARPYGILPANYRLPRD